MIFCSFKQIDWTINLFFFFWIFLSFQSRCHCPKFMLFFMIVIWCLVFFLHLFAILIFLVFSMILCLLLSYIFLIYFFFVYSSYFSILFFILVFVFCYFQFYSYLFFYGIFLFMSEFWIRWMPHVNSTGFPVCFLSPFDFSFLFLCVFSFWNLLGFIQSDFRWCSGFGRGKYIG